MSLARRAKPRNAIVVGGGIAGIACAVRLSEAGVAVTLLETRRKLGGRATSFLDTRSGRTLDNCQHVVLGCCTNYLDLLARLGAADKLRWHREQHWIEEGGRVSTIGPSALPAPLHFAASILKAPMFSAGDIARVAHGCGAIMRTNRAAHEHTTFHHFLRSHAQTDRLIRRFWSPVIVSACNLAVERVSAAAALHVFQEGFLAASTAADIGIPAVPLVELYANVPALIERSGGRVQLGTAAGAVDAHRVTTTDGAALEADASICAVPVERVTRLVADTDKSADARFAPLDRFTHSPILGVHMEFDANVFGDLPHAVLVDRPTQWLFRKNDEGTYAHAVISGADDWSGLSEDETAAGVLADLRACLPAFQRSTEPRLLSARPVREKLATFAPTPGVDALRPGATGASGIILAGDYTATGWPATMEGAARSGYAAAAAALGEDPERFLVPSLRVSSLSRLMGLGWSRPRVQPSWRLRRIT